MMLDVAGVFAAQFVYVLLLGLQSLNVNGRHYAMAAATSVHLGVLGFWLTAMIAEVKTAGVGDGVWWAFVLAGPVGIVVAIYIHPHLHRLYQRWRNK